MRRLMLLRHAKTEADAPSGRDIDRRLTERGLADAAAIGGWFADQRQLADLVLVSTAIRARQTWDQMAHRMPQAQVETLDELYGADPAGLLGIVRAAAVTGPERLLLIGHNPGMHEAAITLTGSGDAALRDALTAGFPTGAVAILDFPAGDWSDVTFRRGQLAAFVTPKLIGAASARG